MIKDRYEQIKAYGKMSGRERQIIDMLSDGYRPAVIMNRMGLEKSQYSATIFCIQRAFGITGSRKYAEEKIQQFKEIRDAYNQYMEEKYTPEISVALIETLSNGEFSVLKLLNRGLTDKEIATEMFKRKETVMWHISCIYKKFGLISSQGDKGRRYALKKIYSQALRYKD